MGRYPYREALKAANVHHVVRVFRNDIGALHRLAQRRDHVRRRVALLRVRQDLLHQQVVLLYPLYGLNQQVSELEYDELVV